MPATKKSQISNLKSSIPTKPRRLEEIASSKAGLFAIDPTLLTVEHGFNHRIHWGDLEALAADIEANGLDQPLKIRKVKNTETIFIVAGHRRHRAITTILIPQGRWQDPENPKQIRTVYCYSEAQGTTQADRLFSQIAGNTGLPYTLLEKARVYQDILCADTTIKPAALARRSGETKQAVSDALCLVNQGCSVLISNVQDGTLTATTAIQIIKQSKDHSEQESIFIAALEKAHLAGSPHVTPKHLPSANPPESGLIVPPAVPDSTSSHPTSNIQHSKSSANPLFTLYEIPDAPQDPLPNSSYHETNRLVLSPLPDGCTILHLLSALDEFGEPCYGYRYNDITLLPNPAESSSAGALPEEGFAAILNCVTAFASIFNDESDPAFRATIEDALYDALCRYFPEQGTPEEPQTLAFVAIPDAPTSEETGYQAIVNAPSSNRDGSGTGSGGSGFVSPEAGMKSVNQVLEDLDGSGLPDRVTAVEIAMRICNGESTPATLKNYLLGK